MTGQIEPKTIHIDTARGGLWLTDAECKEQFPKLFAMLRAPRPFNEGGEKVKKIRKKYGLTIMELARRAGLKLGDLSAIETGRGEATTEQLDAIGLAVSILKPAPVCNCGKEGQP